MFDSVKPWYVSRTIWASIVAVAASCAGALGFPFDDGQQALATDVILQMVGALGGLAAIYGRLVATKRINSP